MASIVNILPFDILEHIIDCVATHDYREHKHQSTYIKACSLTCRTFFEAGCRKHIFRCIVVRKGRIVSWRKTFELFAKFLIQRGPMVGAFIREISIIMSDSKDGPHGHFAPALQYLTALDTLTICPDSSASLSIGRAEWGYNYFIPWYSLNPSTKSLLLNLIHLSTIRTLELQNIFRFNAADLVGCRNLRHLVVEKTSFDFEWDSDMGTTVSNVAPIRLQKLDLKGNRSILSLPRLLENRFQISGPPLDLKDLRTVSFVFDGYANFPQGSNVYDAVAKLFTRASHLEEVCFRFQSFRLVELVPAVSLSFRSLGTLRRLSLDIKLPHDCTHPLLGVPTVLQDMFGKNAIEILKIYVRTYGASLNARGTGDEWGSLEKALLAPGGWPYLKQVDLTIVTGFRGRPFERALEDLPKTQFLGLTSSNSIQFNFLVCEKL